VNTNQFTLYHGDCYEVMKSMPDNSVDSIVTDPPYELGFMGKSWDSTGIAYSTEMWTEALRVLKTGGHLIAFSGSRTYHRMAVAIEDAGFQIRDQIMWVYGSGFPKSHNLKDEWQGWGTALKPAHEPIVLARKPFIGTVANNISIYGVGAINIDASRIDIAEGDEPSAGSRTATFGTQETVSGGDGSGGWEAASGRWPANFIHDGSDEVVALFPDTTSGKPAGKKNIGNGYHGNFGSIDVTGFGDSGSAARFFYCAKASKKDRNDGLEGFAGKEIGAKGNGLARQCATCGASVLGGCECADRTYVNPTRANHHPTVKPTALMQYLVKLVTPPNGTVLDPFLGSGSTGKACMYEGFNFVGIELTEEYLPIAKARIEFAQKDKELK
jgi:site-specific DNA-methyltransferase (adenine-specific)